MVLCQGLMARNEDHMCTGDIMGNLSIHFCISFGGHIEFFMSIYFTLGIALGYDHYRFELNLSKNDRVIAIFCFSFGAVVKFASNTFLKASSK